MTKFSTRGPCGDCVALSILIVIDCNENWSTIRQVFGLQIPSNTKSGHTANLRSVKK